MSEQPKPVENQNPAIKRFLAPIASQIADRTKTTTRHPDQNPDCQHTAGTLSCLEAGGEMCNHCQWWDDFAAGED